MDHHDLWEIIGFIINFIIVIGVLIRNHSRIEHRITVLETYIKILLKENGFKVE